MGKYKIPKTQHLIGSKQYHNSHQIGIAHMIFVPLFMMFILWMMFLLLKRFKFYTMLMLIELRFEIHHSSIIVWVTGTVQEICKGGKRTKHAAICEF